MNVDQAYRRCEEITAAEARNFSYGIKLLAPGRRQAMSALYALARRIDDIGDGDGSAAAKLVALAEVRKAVAELDSPPCDDPVLVAMSDVAARFPVPLSAIDELIDGCEMDVLGTRYDTFEELVGYCRRVAGTVGRLSLAVYGAAGSSRAEAMADDLGVALQITNILRDIAEDRDQMGRVYLPGEDLARFGVGPGLDGPEDGIVALVAFETARAEEWFDRGLPLLPILDHRSRACTAAMAGIYRELLRSIRRDPAAVLRGRVSVPGWRKAAIAARALTVGSV